MMNFAEIELKIIAFWNWFKENERDFREIEDTKTAIENLNNQILEFGLFSWEIGEGVNKPWYLSISPNGDRERLQISKMIVDLAPEFTKWEFFFCKRPIDWDFSLELYDQYMLKQQYLASQWEYALIEQPSGKVDLQLYAENIQRLDMDDQLMGAEYAIISILGEENRILCIDKIKIVQDFEAELEERVAFLPDLKKDFDLIFKDSMY